MGLYFTSPKKKKTVSKNINLDEKKSPHSEKSQKM